MGYGWTEVVREGSHFLRSVGAAALGNALVARGARTETQVLLPTINLTCPVPVCPVIDCRCSWDSSNYGSTIFLLGATVLIAFGCFICGIKCAGVRTTATPGGKNATKTILDVGIDPDDFAKPWTPSRLRR